MLSLNWLLISPFWLLVNEQLRSSMYTNGKQLRTYIIFTGMMSATATLGMILLWDVDGGLTQIDKYLYSNEDWIKAGALLACGIVNSGVRNECDPALALLSDYTSHQTNVIRIGSIVG